MQPFANQVRREVRYNHPRLVQRGYADRPCVVSAVHSSGVKILVSVRCFALALAAASLAGCAAQSSVASRKSEFVAIRHAAIERHRGTRIAAVEDSSIVRRHDPYASEKNTGDLKLPSSGVASFYTDTRTASGEKFNPEELTAAHPTLPFGTKLRVTNAVTGRSVTVRVNDRGPYVHGRVVDVTHSAAQALGMVGSGIAKVRLDVVE
jgi:peptidoglycan lytic transglycosylase